MIGSLQFFNEENIAKIARFILFRFIQTLPNTRPRQILGWIPREKKENLGIN